MGSHVKTYEVRGRWQNVEPSTSLVEEQRRQQQQPQQHAGPANHHLLPQRQVHCRRGGRRSGRPKDVHSGQKPNVEDLSPLSPVHVYTVYGTFTWLLFPTYILFIVHAELYNLDSFSYTAVDSPLGCTVRTLLRFTMPLAVAVQV